MNLGSLLDLTRQLKQIYFETAHEVGFEPGPQHFGYLMRCLVADTDEKAQEIGRTFLWTEDHRNRGPVEFNDPPGYQSREALRIKMSRPLIGTGTMGRRMSYEDLQEAHNIIVGSPETVIKKLRYVRETLDPGYLLLYGNEGDMPHEAVMRSIELLGTRVIPALKED
jgi:alkanesulfonate monooxygenase SsuD/methylene tetrahydromethanopterin reductase-like flavin-dependent oxidoreductase (luciferase family)